MSNDQKKTSDSNVELKIVSLGYEVVPLCMITRERGLEFFGPDGANAEKARRRVRRQNARSTRKEGKAESEGKREANEDKGVE